MMLWPIIRTTVLATALLLAGGGRAWSEPLFGENFGTGTGDQAASKAKETRWGKGWRAAVGGDIGGAGDIEYLKYPAGGKISPAGGTVELEVVRDNEGIELESFFALLGDKGVKILSARIWWEGRGGYGDGPFLEFSVGNRRLYGDLWYSRGRGENPDARSRLIPLPDVRQGESMHLAFTWGSSMADCNVYVDGRLLKTEKDAPFPMGDLVRRAKWIVIGAEPDG